MSDNYKLLSLLKLSSQDAQCRTCYIISEMCFHSENSIIYLDISWCICAVYLHLVFIVLQAYGF